MGIPVLTKLVKRTKNTIPQKELDLSARQNNLKKAFKLCRNDVKLNTIIIIDDIYTTGSTIDAVAEQFREAGVKKIYFVAISGGR
jgi:predicted amidophosphoribosyltransferase